MAPSGRKSNLFTTPPAEPAGPLVGALLRVPYEAVREHILERLHAAGFDDIDQAHFNVFQYPGPQGRRPSEITAHARVSKQAMNYLLNHLEARGYFERRADPDDARSKRIVLTRRGEAVRRVIRDAVNELEKAVVRWPQDAELTTARERFAEEAKATSEQARRQAEGAGAAHRVT